MMKDYSDQYLLSQIARKDLQCFEWFLLRYEERVYRFVLRLVRVPELAEEITQDAFIRLWEGGEKAADIQSAGAWLFTVSRNRSLNVLKEMAARYLREQHYAASMPQTTEEDVAEKEYQHLLYAYAGQLPPKRREIFLLKIDKGLSNEEISQHLHISPHTVKSQLQKSYQTIRKLLSDNTLLLLLWSVLR